MSQLPQWLTGKRMWQQCVPISFPARVAQDAKSVGAGGAKFHGSSAAVPAAGLPSPAGDGMGTSTGGMGTSTGGVRTGTGGMGTSTGAIRRFLGVLVTMH